MTPVLPSKGQAALDALLAMIIILVVLFSFSNVLDTFTLSQKTISVQRQLRDNAELSTHAITHDSWYFHRSQADGGYSQGDEINSYSGFHGQTPLHTIKLLERAQGVGCVPDTSNLANELKLTARSTDTGLPQDISTFTNLGLTPGYTATLQFNECLTFLEVEGP